MRTARREGSTNADTSCAAGRCPSVVAGVCVERTVALSLLWPPRCDRCQTLPTETAAHGLPASATNMIRDPDLRAVASNLRAVLDATTKIPETQEQIDDITWTIEMIEALAPKRKLGRSRKS